MLCVETIGKIRRRRLVHGESISAIARDLGLSSTTVKRALRFEGEAYEYRRVRQPMPKLGPYLVTLEGWLEVEQTLPARERRTAQRLYEALCLEGYTGAVDAVRRQIRELERRRHPSTTAFIPQSFASGETYQFDWSHEHVHKPRRSATRDARFAWPSVSPLAGPHLRCPSHEPRAPDPARSSWSRAGSCSRHPDDRDRRTRPAAAAALAQRRPDTRRSLECRSSSAAPSNRCRTHCCNSHPAGVVDIGARQAARQGECAQHESDTHCRAVPTVRSRAHASAGDHLVLSARDSAHSPRRTRRG